MFYVSSVRYSNNGDKLYGIMDTSDDVEEFYSADQLHSILNKIGYTEIKGAVYTGSYVKCEAVTPVIVAISELPKYESFKLSINGKVFKFMKTGELSTGKGWHITEGKVPKTLTKQWLIENKDNVCIV